MAFCGNCGQPIPDGAKFCTSCGAPVNSGGNNSNIQETNTQEAPVQEVVQPVQEAVQQPVVEQVQPQVQAQQPEPQVASAQPQQQPIQQAQPQQGYVPLQQIPPQQAVQQAQPQQGYVPPRQIPPQAQQQQPVQPQGAPAKKSKLPLILGIAGGAVVLLVLLIVIISSVVSRAGKSATAGSGDALARMLDQAGYNAQFSTGETTASKPSNVAGPAVSGGNAGASSGDNGSSAGDSGAGTSDKGTITSGSDIVIADTSGMMGQPYETDGMVVFIPEGWAAFPVLDMWSDDGSYDPYKLRVIKGGKSEDDVFTNNYIEIEYKPDASGSIYRDSYENIVDIDSLKLGSYDYSGVVGDYYSYRIAMLLADYADGYISGTAYLTMDSGTISLNDADVQAILGSIVIK